MILITIRITFYLVFFPEEASGSAAIYTMSAICMESIMDIPDDVFEQYHGCMSFIRADSVPLVFSAKIDSYGVLSNLTFIRPPYLNTPRF